MLQAHEFALSGILGTAIVGILVVLHIRSKNKDSKIQLDDLLLGDDGKISKAAFVLIGSFIMTSWVIIFQTMNKTLTDTTFAAYIAAWIVPVTARLIKGSTPSATSSSAPTQQP